MGQRSQRLKRGRGRRASGLSGWLAGPAGRWWENTRDAAERGAMLGRGGSGDFGPGEWHRWAKRWVREGEKNGPAGWVAVGLGLVLDLLLFSNSYSFSKANTQILFEFKFQFEFKPNTQTKRTMHQHECNIKFLNLDKF